MYLRQHQVLSVIQITTNRLFFYSPASLPELLFFCTLTYRLQQRSRDDIRVLSPFFFPVVLNLRTLTIRYCDSMTSAVLEGICSQYS